MNDTRDQVGECAGKLGSRACRRDGGQSRRGGAMVAVYAGVFTALFSAGVVGREKKSVEAAPAEPAAAVAGVAAAVAGGGGGGGGGESAADARERMEADGSKMVKASLLFSEKVKLPGAEESVGTLAVAFDIEPGWHTYWRNAGDSGMPPTFEFTVDPAGAMEIGEAQWPVPQRHLAEGDILDYIYEGRVLHLFEVERGPAFKAGEPVKVTCAASWLVCKEACLPGEGKAEVVIRPQGDSTASLSSNEEMSKWVWMLPRTPQPTYGMKYEWNNGQLSISALGGGCPVSFFPFAEDGDLLPIDLANSGAVEASPLILKFDAEELKPGKRVRGVVRVEESRCVKDASTTAYLLETKVP